MDYSQHYSVKQTPQDQLIPGTKQVRNSAGGYTWTIDKWGKLDRFLILGTEGGTYYIKERELTVQNAENVKECIGEDGVRVVKRVVEISLAGRAPKNDPALFVLAMCASFGNDETRKAAFYHLGGVARIGTHLFHFLQYVSNLRGWGRGLRKAIQDWYLTKRYDELAYQLVKYQQRDGWSHRDALRLSHPVPFTSTYDDLFEWVVDKGHPMTKTLEDIPLIKGFHELRISERSEREVANIIDEYKLPWEAVPAQYLSSKVVWETLIKHLPMTALIRNLGRLTALEILKPNNNYTAYVVETLSNKEYLKKSRIHPIQVLSALNTYKNGGGYRGNLTWKSVGAINRVLDNMFYRSFDNVTPTDKRLVIGLDVSSSMNWGMIGVVGLTPAMASAALALVTANVENKYEFVAFAETMREVDISGDERLTSVLNKLDRITFGGTDCALPMIWAAKREVPADAFIIYTDNETWAGDIHPAQALKRYRKKMGIPAKLIVVAMTANEFKIADPNDAGMLDIVGFDTATPNLISGFIRES